MKCLKEIKEELHRQSNPEKAVFLAKYMQAFPGGYGEGDRFIGLTVPNLRKVAKKYYRVIALDEAEQLFAEAIHEYRLTALFILVLKSAKAKAAEEKRTIVDVYLRNTRFINNWDLVDCSADKILGPYFLEQNKDLLYQFLQSGDLWKQRIAVMTTFHFIRNNLFADTLAMAALLLNHPHDLIHKAVGWMLREIGKRDLQVELDFLNIHYRQMPRTMLRYAIEKFDESLRQQYLKGQV